MSFQEIDAWARLTGTLIHPREVLVLRAMDAIRTRIWNERKSDKEPDKLIDLRDKDSITALFRGMQGETAKSDPE